MSEAHNERKCIHGHHCFFFVNESVKMSEEQILTMANLSLRNEFFARYAMTQEEYFTDANRGMVRVLELEQENERLKAELEQLKAATKVGYHDRY